MLTLSLSLSLTQLPILLLHVLLLLLQPLDFIHFDVGLGGLGLGVTNELLGGN